MSETLVGYGTASQFDNKVKTRVTIIRDKVSFLFRSFRKLTYKSNVTPVKS